MKLDYLKKTVLGKLVKITADFNFRGFGKKEINTVVGTVVAITKWGIEIGHPIVPSTNKMTNCGASNFGLAKIVRIEEATSAEMGEWRKSYKKFHESVIAEKGYDSCEEDADNTILFICDTPLDFSKTTINV